MTPLGLTAAGFLLAALDFRVNAGFDLLPDPVGWVLAAVGLAALSERSAGFRVAQVLALLEALVSLPMVVTEQPGTLVTSADAALETAFVFSVCTGLIASLPHRPDRTGSANVIRWLDLGLAVVLVPSLLLLDAADGGLDVLGPLALMLILVGLAVAVWFVVLLFQVKDDPAVSRSGHAVA